MSWFYSGDRPSIQYTQSIQFRLSQAVNSVQTVTIQKQCIGFHSRKGRHFNSLRHLILKGECVVIFTYNRKPYKWLQWNFLNYVHRIMGLNRLLHSSRSNRFKKLEICQIHQHFSRGHQGQGHQILRTVVCMHGTTTPFIDKWRHVSTTWQFCLKFDLMSWNH